MKPRTLLILLAVVLALGAFIWFYERKLPSSEERATLGKKVLELDKAEVTAVAIDSPKGKIRLERTGGGATPKGKKGSPLPRRRRSNGGSSSRSPPAPTPSRWTACSTASPRWRRPARSTTSIPRRWGWTSPGPWCA